MTRHAEHVHAEPHRSWGPGLRVSSPSDRAEREADAIADRVLAMPGPTSHPLGVTPAPAGLHPSPGGCNCPDGIRRQPDDDLDEDELQRQPEDEEEELHLRPDGPGGHAGPVTSADVAGMGTGQPLPTRTRAFFEPRFGADLSQVRIHTDTRAADLADRVHARAFTHHSDIAFAAGAYQPDTTAGRHLLAHELAHTVQQNLGRAGLQRQVAANVDASLMTDEELARDFILTQRAILGRWSTAVENFETVLRSASDKAGTADFRGVVEDLFKDRLTSELTSRIPGTGTFIDLMKGFEKEADRATKAAASAKLRDFVVEHRRAVSDLLTLLETSQENFVASVRIAREHMEATGETDAYGLIRLQLVDGIRRLDAIEAWATHQRFFQYLSEEWIRRTTLRERGGTRPARLLITLNADRTIRKAKIEGAGGQKIADQLVKDHPQGVDVFGLAVPKKVIELAENDYPRAVLVLDASNHFTNGWWKWQALYNYLRSHRPEPTSNVNR